MKIIKAEKIKTIAKVIRRRLDEMPFDKRIENEDGRTYLCHATGFEVLWSGIWWNEFIDAETGELFI